MTTIRRRVDPTHPANLRRTRQEREEEFNRHRQHRTTSVRDMVDRMMRHAIANEWDGVTRTARQLQSMTNANHRQVEIDRWMRAHARDCPEHVRAWYEQQRREYEEATEAARPRLTTGTPWPPMQFIK
jgi:hypothetical protein